MRSPASRPRLSAKPDFDSLVDLIIKTVQPETWQNKGGQGTIACSETNLSLVISQTHEVHEEIVDLLEQIRRMQDLWVVLDARFITLGADSREKIDANLNSGTLDRSKARNLIDIAQRSPTASLLQIPRLTLFNGQTAAFSAPVGGQSCRSYAVLAVVSDDRRQVRLSLTADGSPDKGLMTVSVKDGDSLLADLTPRPAAAAATKTTAAQGNKLLLLVTPQIVVQEEEEDKLGPPAR